MKQEVRSHLQQVDKTRRNRTSLKSSSPRTQSVANVNIVPIHVVLHSKNHLYASSTIQLQILYVDYNCFIDFHLLHGRGTGHSFRAISFVSLFVSLSATLRENGWTDLHEIFREGVE